MANKLLISPATEKTTKLKGLEKLLKQAAGDSTDSVASVGDETKGSSAFAIVDGTKLIQSDPEEQEVLARAIDNGFPVVLENASKGAMTQATGLGIEAEIAIIRQARDGVHISAVVPVIAKPSGHGEEEHIPPVTGDTASTDEKKEEKLKESGVVPIPSLEVAEIPLAEQVLGILNAESPADTTAVSTASMDEPSVDLEQPISYYLDWHPLRQSIKWDDGGSQPVNVSPHVKIELYATNKPNNKFLVITTAGGISPGTLRYDEDTVRGYFLKSAFVEYGPVQMPSGMSILDSSPENANNSSSVSYATGFELGGSLSKDGPELSGSYNSSTARTLDLSDFSIENKIDSIRGRWDYNLSSVEGNPYYKSSDLYAGPLTFRWLHLPNIARNGLQPETHVVWKAPAEFNGKLKFNFKFGMTLRMTWMTLYKNIFGMTVRATFHHDDFDFLSPWDGVEIDFSQVQAPKMPERSIPNFAARILVEYKPKEGEVFTLRSLGDGTFEILESSTVQIPPEPEPEIPILAYHTVKQGDMLSALSLHYYGSAARAKWIQIYYANREIMGSSYNNIRPGMVLKIPDLEGKKNWDDHPRA